MTDLTRRSFFAGLALLGCLGMPSVSHSQTPPGPSWSRLSATAPGTVLVVTLADGRRLQRYHVEADAGELTVANLGLLTSRDQRETVLQILRDNPSRFAVSATFEDGGGRVQVVEHFDRASVLRVARPGSFRRDPGILEWFLAASGPCRNCDPRQMLMKRTVLPTVEKARAASTEGEVLYEVVPLTASDMPARLAWPNMRGWVPDQQPAQGKDQEKKAALNVTGKWTMTLDMSMGTATPSLDLKQDGEKITGTYTGRYGTFDLQGTLKDRAIQFSFNMSAEGEVVTMSFAGEVAEDGQAMKGTATLGEMGDATWTAQRNKN